MSLCIMRRRNESILIGTPDGEIRVTVYEVRDHAAKIAIDAPKWMPVIRDELQHREGARWHENLAALRNPDGKELSK